MKGLVPFAAGGIFALGLGLGGMTIPARVTGFLDIFGRWDPSLALVMAGALAVHLPFVQWLSRSRRAPEQRSAGDPIDALLVLGAAVFGVGWGLSGLCPGPALVSLAGGRPDVFLFVAAMFGGMLVGRALGGRRLVNEC